MHIGSDSGAPRSIYQCIPLVHLAKCIGNFSIGMPKVPQVEPSVALFIHRSPGGLTFWRLVFHRRLDRLRLTISPPLFRPWSFCCSCYRDPASFSSEILRYVPILRAYVSCRSFKHHHVYIFNSFRVISCINLTLLLIVHLRWRQIHWYQ